MTIRIPEELREWIDEAVRTGGYEHASEYVRDVIRADWKRQLRDRIDQRLSEAIERADRGEGIEVTPEWWAELRASVRDAAEEQRRSRAGDRSTRDPPDSG